MRKLMIGIVAAGTLMAAAPAMAQVVVEGPGVGVRVGERGNHYGWDRGRHYGWRNHTGWRSYARGDCRSVTVRERLPNGRVLVRTRERC
jgi:hypothetical protein